MSSKASPPPWYPHPAAKTWTGLTCSTATSATHHELHNNKPDNHHQQWQPRSDHDPTLQRPAAAEPNAIRHHNIQKCILNIRVYIGLVTNTERQRE